MWLYWEFSEKLKIQNTPPLIVTTYSQLVLRLTYQILYHTAFTWSFTVLMHNYYVYICLWESLAGDGASNDSRYNFEIFSDKTKIVIW